VTKLFKIFLLVGGAVVLTFGIAFGSYAVVKHFQKKNGEKQEQKQTAQKSNRQEKSKTVARKKPAYTLVSYAGIVFGAKVPRGWQITDNESGIDIMNPSDKQMGASGAVAVGWFGTATPDSFIDFMIKAIGGHNVKYLNVSVKETVKDPYTGLRWVMRTKTFLFTNKEGKRIKAKASAGVLNGYGQFSGMIVAFQSTTGKWSKWAPTLERVAQSITIINPSKAGGIDKVRLPTAADLANDSSPLMEAWEYRNQVQEKTSHEFSDAIMGQESGLYSPSTGRSYILPLTAYDPTIGGYRNPDKPSEILRDRYR